MAFKIECITEKMNDLVKTANKIKVNVLLRDGIRKFRIKGDVDTLVKNNVKAFGNSGYTVSLVQAYKEFSGSLKGFVKSKVETIFDKVKRNKKLYNTLNKIIKKKYGKVSDELLIKELETAQLMYKSGGLTDMLKLVDKDLGYMLKKFVREKNKIKKNIIGTTEIPESLGYGEILTGRGVKRMYIAGYGAALKDMIENGTYKSTVGDVILMLGNFVNAVKNVVKQNKNIKTFEELIDALEGQNKKIAAQIKNLFGKIDLEDFLKQIDKYQYKGGISAKLANDIDDIWTTEIKKRQVEDNIQSIADYIEKQGDLPIRKKVVKFAYETIGLLYDEMKSRFGDNKYVKEITNKLYQAFGGYRIDRAEADKLIKQYGFDDMEDAFRWLNKNNKRIKYIRNNDIITYIDYDILPRMYSALDGLQEKLDKAKKKAQKLEYKIKIKQLKKNTKRIEEYRKQLEEDIKNHGLSNEELNKVKGFMETRNVINKKAGKKLFEGGYAINNFEDLIKEEKAIIAKSIDLSSYNVGRIVEKLGLGVDKTVQSSKELYTVLEEGLKQLLDENVFGIVKRDVEKIFVDAYEDFLDVIEAMFLKGNVSESERKLFLSVINDFKKDLDGLRSIEVSVNRLKKVLNKPLADLDKNDMLTLLFILRNEGVDGQTISFILGQWLRYNRVNRFNQKIKKISITSGIKKSYDIDPRLLDLYGEAEYTKQLEKYFDRNLRLANNVKALGNNYQQLNLFFDKIGNELQKKLREVDLNMQNSKTEKELKEWRKKFRYLANQLVELQRDKKVITDLLDLGIVHTDAPVGLGKYFYAVADFVNKLGVLKLVHFVNLAQDFARGLAFWKKDRKINSIKDLDTYLTSTYKLLIDNPYKSDLSMKMNEYMDKMFKYTGMEKVNVAANKQVFLSMFDDLKNSLLKYKKGGTPKNEFEKELFDILKKKNIIVDDAIGLLDELGKGDTFEILDKLNDIGIMPMVNNYTSRFTTVNGMIDVPMMYLKNYDNAFVQAFGTFIKFVMKLTGTLNKSFENSYVREKYIKVAGLSFLFGGMAQALYDLIGGNLSDIETSKLEEKLKEDFYMNLVGSYALWYSYIINGILYKTGILDEIGIHSKTFQYIYSNTANVFMGALGSNMRDAINLVSNTCAVAKDTILAQDELSTDANKLAKIILKYIPFLNKAALEYYNNK